MCQRDLEDSLLVDVHADLVRLKRHVLHTITSITPDGNYWTMMRSLCDLPPYVDRKISHALARLEVLIDSRNSNSLILSNSSTEGLDNGSRESSTSSQAIKTNQISNNSNVITSSDIEQDNEQNVEYENENNYKHFLEKRKKAIKEEKEKEEEKGVEEDDDGDEVINEQEEMENEQEEGRAEKEEEGVEEDGEKDEMYQRLNIIKCVQ